MLEVFGAGFGRTGTLSLKTALEKLGFGPCHHMESVFGQEEQADLWLRAAEGGLVDWERVYDGYRAGVDWPGARFWREITAAFPEAKVILTVRDPEKWYESALNSIYPVSVRPQAGANPDFEKGRQMALAVIWEGVFGGRFEDRDHALRLYSEHREAVTREIDSDRLLVFDVRQGWEPLCGFLGVPVPDEPFPRTNDRAQLLAKAEEHATRAHS